MLFLSFCALQVSGSRLVSRICSSGAPLAENVTYVWLLRDHKVFLFVFGWCFLFVGGFLSSWFPFVTVGSRAKDHG